MLLVVSKHSPSILIISGCVAVVSDQQYGASAPSITKLLSLLATHIVLIDRYAITTFLLHTHPINYSALSLIEY